MEDCQTPTSKKSNIEICDIYDIYGNRTGKTFIRGEPLSDGQFVMVVDVWIVNSKEMCIRDRIRVDNAGPGNGNDIWFFFAAAADHCWSYRCQQGRAFPEYFRHLFETSFP